MAHYLHRVFLCDIDSLPTELLLHRYWTNPNQWGMTPEYSVCLHSQRIFQPDACQISIRGYCGERFDQMSPDRLDECFHLLNNRTYRRLHRNGDVRKLFDKYESCFSSRRDKVDRLCARILREACVGRRLRVLKVVRTTMESVRPLLESLPTLRVVHLLRDPRAVALSRSAFGESGRGGFALRQNIDNVAAAEASVFCQHAGADVRTRLTLEHLFPGRFYTTTYEQFVSDPVASARDIYRFMNETLPAATVNSLRQAADEFRGTRSTVELATKWQKKMTYAVAAAIARNCTRLINFVDQLTVE